MAICDAEPSYNIARKLGCAVAGVYTVIGFRNVGWRFMSIISQLKIKRSRW